MPNYFAVCAAGIEPATVAELTRLGAAEVRLVPGGVHFSGDQGTLYRSCLWLRTPSRILQPLREFAAGSAQMLYSQTRRVRWEEYLDPSKTFAVHATIEGGSGRRGPSRRAAPPAENAGAGEQDTKRQGIHHSLFAALKIKDAIVDRLRREQGARPNVDRDHPDLLVHAHFSSGRCSLSLDAVGGSLHERGYRAESAPAPLKETLAAAIVELSGWDGTRPLVDLMCGSGTLLIEAALRGLEIAPGLSREQFACQRWPDYDAALWDQACDAARRQRHSSLPVAIVGYDSDPEALRLARENARRAGVERVIRWELHSLDQAPAPSGAAGVILTNPPYGERLGVAAELTRLYQQLGEVLVERFGGWTAWVLAGNLPLARHIALEATAKLKLYNGPIPCRLLRFEPKTPPD
ncbi:MAG: class I SAM-dependent RNA methyltransferase [Planctomycetales bacterium]